MTQSVSSDKSRQTKDGGSLKVRRPSIGANRNNSPPLSKISSPCPDENAMNTGPCNKRFSWFVPEGSRADFRRRFRKVAVAISDFPVAPRRGGKKISLPLNLHIQETCPQNRFSASERTPPHPCFLTGTENLLLHGPYH